MLRGESPLISGLQVDARGHWASGWREGGRLINRWELLGCLRQAHRDMSFCGSQPSLCHPLWGIGWSRRTSLQRPTGSTNGDEARWPSNLPSLDIRRLWAMRHLWPVVGASHRSLCHATEPFGCTQRDSCTCMTGTSRRALEDGLQPRGSIRRGARVVRARCMRGAGTGVVP